MDLEAFEDRRVKGRAKTDANTRCGQVNLLGVDWRQDKSIAQKDKNQPPG